MAKGVLGNDPFRRGAADRAPSEETPSKAKKKSVGRATAGKLARGQEVKPARPVAKETEPAKSPVQPERSALGAKSKAHRPPSRQEAPRDSADRDSTEELALRLRQAVPPLTVNEDSARRSQGGPESPVRRIEVVAPAEVASLEPPKLHERAVGAISLARDLLAQTVDRPEVSTLARSAQGTWRLIQAGLGTRSGERMDLFGRDPDLLAAIQPLRDFLYERYWRVTVENAAALPSGGVILVANHAGALPLDGPVLAEVVHRERPDLAEPRWLVEDQIFHTPFWGTLFNRLGAVRASPENAARLLEEKRPLLVFPEGKLGLGKPFSERYRLKRFGRGGFVKLALRQNVPILPVAIVGAEETTPLLAKLPGKRFGLPHVPITGPLPLPAKWMVRFGTPIVVRPPPGDELAFVQQLAERTRSEIEAMLGSLLRQRTGVFSR